MPNGKYRLVTRSDFDGLVCAVLLRELGLIEDILFVHPKDLQDGKVPITGRDITTNLPYVHGVHLAFDHHISEGAGVGTQPNQVIGPAAPSAARLVWRHYGGRDRFPAISDALLDAVDQADSAHYSRSDILAPEGWTLLNFIMDARTGLGRFRSFRISKYALMAELVDYCRNHSIDETLALPDVRERVEMYWQHQRAFIDQLERCARLEGAVVTVGLRDQDPIWAGNRLMIYALYPAATVSIHVIKGLRGQNTVLAVGRSILNRASAVNLGALLRDYGGGGHAAAGTCQVANEQADSVLATLVRRINQGG